MKVIEQICHRVAVIDHSHIVEIGEVQEVFGTQVPDCASAYHSAGRSVEQIQGKRCLRIVFDGNSSFEAYHFQYDASVSGGGQHPVCGY